MSMFNDISCDNKGNEEECLANARVASILAKKFGIRQWSIYWSRFREEVEFNVREQSTKNLGSHRGQDAVGIR